MAPLVPRRRRWSNSRGQWLAPLVTGPELQRAELAEGQVPAEAACRVIVLRDLQGVCSSVADFSGDSRFCPTTTTRSSTRIRGSKSPPATLFRRPEVGLRRGEGPSVRSRAEDGRRIRVHRGARRRRSPVGVYVAARPDQRDGGGGPRDGPRGRDEVAIEVARRRALRRPKSRSAGARRCASWYAPKPWYAAGGAGTSGSSSRI